MYAGMIQGGVFSPYVCWGCVPALVWGGLCLLPGASGVVLSSAHSLKRCSRSFATGVGLWVGVLSGGEVEFAGGSEYGSTDPLVSGRLPASR